VTQAVWLTPLVARFPGLTPIVSFWPPWFGVGKRRNREPSPAIIVNLRRSFKNSEKKTTPRSGVNRFEGLTETGGKVIPESGAHHGDDFFTQAPLACPPALVRP